MKERPVPGAYRTSYKLQGVHYFLTFFHIGIHFSLLSVLRVVLIHPPNINVLLVRQSFSMLWRASRHFINSSTYPGVSITVLNSRSLFRDSFRQCLAASTVGDLCVCGPARLSSSSSSVGCSKSSQRVIQVVEHSASADNVELRISSKTFRSNGTEWVSVDTSDDDSRSLLRRQQPGKKRDRRQLGVIPTQDYFRRMFRKYFVDKFLPNGYPDSVGEGYAKYSGLSFIGTTSSSIIMVLSTQALLQAVGLSDGVALGISATLNWVIKDGIGQFGGIMFASYLGKTKSFDMDPKRWYVVR